jgi:hypothetical protein
LKKEQEFVQDHRDEMFDDTKKGYKMRAQISYDVEMLKRIVNEMSPHVDKAPK